MKRLFVCAGILFVCFIQACNNNTQPVTIGASTNDSAYDKDSATERVVKPGVQKKSMHTKNPDNINNTDNNTNNSNEKNNEINNETRKHENTKANKAIKENAPDYNPIQQDTPYNNNVGVHLNADEVPGAVISAMHIKYPTVRTVKWVMKNKTGNTLYIAHWQAHKTKMMAVFDEDGRFIRER